ncbi:MAG TPA: NUDIX hydrolase [Anaerolineaceae bacterium]|jgi:ADP-ribose pyrophosphatase
MPVEYLHSEEIYQGRAFNLRRDRLRLPDGRETTYDVVEHPGAVTIVPVDDQGRMWFVRQYRSGVRDTLLELPAGTRHADEDPQLCALREVREEIGQAARQIQKIGEVYLVPGYSTEYMYFYLATGLYPDPLDMDDDEFIEVESYPVSQVYAMAAAGEMRDGKTLAALLLAKPYLEKYLK